MVSRRSLLAGATTLVATAFAEVPATAAAEKNFPAPLTPEARARRVDWLDRNAAALRSIEFSDDDFSDLDPLRRAVGSARIVLLGEQSHGDGTTFVAKSRLVRFLHAKMGFDVLAFESGFYDMPEAWKQIRGGKPVRSAIRNGLYEHWSLSAEMRPLIDYIGEQAGKDRPLELTGFDLKFTKFGPTEVTKQLATFLNENGVDTGSIGGWARFSGVLDNLSDGSKFGWFRPSEEDHRVVVSTADALIGRLATITTADAAYWRQLLKSIKSLNEWLLKLDLRNDGDVDQLMRRDIPMGDNLAWLARDRYPQRKIIVWAASLHTMRNFHLMGPSVKDARLMGDLVWDAFGEETYSIGFTAYQGARGWVGQPETPIPRADADSLEGLWGAAGQSNSFLDLRKVVSGGNWLDQPIVSSLVNGEPYLIYVRKHFDAVFCIRTMHRSTWAK